MYDQRYSDNDQSKRDIPSFIEPRPPVITNPFMRPRPQKGTNLLELFEEDSETEEPELVQVYLRMKPHQIPSYLYEVKSDRCLITSVDTATAGHGRRTQHNVSKMYTFSHIFDSEATQKEIFEHVVKENLKKLPNGHSFTLLTYGTSGSGKTYTLMGTVASPGLVPRSLEYVFRVVDAAQQPLFKPADGGAEKLSLAEQDYELQWVKKLRHISAPLRDKYRRMSVGLQNDLTASSLDLSNRTRHYVWVSFVEIYNEAIYDLLATRTKTSASKLRIREDASGHVYVKGVTQAFVRSGEEAYDIMVAGKHNLQVAATGVHAHSSRSHCIFTITLLTETDAGVSLSCVRLCDLAGCERARHTKNTGARMAESRAINSSLHVLERCLHTLRRRARTACVPYRESKLTRLLGAGLSGTRGEAVSMVVTLNPAAEYAHETRHVLQLAAVARDIQINNTIAETILESTQDTTIYSNAEVMKLRADNERLHFELVQAQARIKELMSMMEEKQLKAANTMRELVEEAKDMTRQYYESQIKSLKQEMEEMAEEYEDRLSKALAPSTEPLQNEVAELMTKVALLQEKVTTEQLARVCVEEEVQHLRACVEERDEKAFEENSDQQNDVMMLTDSECESDEEDDLNASLEPTFTKEVINKSLLLLKRDNDRNSIHHHESNGEGNGFQIDKETVEICVNKTSVRENNFDKNEDLCKPTESSKLLTRGTYFISNKECTVNVPEMAIESKNDEDIYSEEESKDKVDMLPPKLSENFVNKIIKSIKKSHRTDNSLAQFEQLELAADECDEKKTTDGSEIVQLKVTKEKKTYFDDIPKRDDVVELLPNPTLSKEKKTYFDNITVDSIDANIEKPENKKINDLISNVEKAFDHTRSPSIVKEEFGHDIKPSTMKILLGECVTRPLDAVSSVHKNTLLFKKHDSLDLFEGLDSPQLNAKPADGHDIIENARKSIEQLVLEQEVAATYIKQEFKLSQALINEEPLPKELPNESASEFLLPVVTNVLKNKSLAKESNVKPETTETHNKATESQVELKDNTIDEFENIYKDITAPRDTEFDLLVQDTTNSTINDDKIDKKEPVEEVKYNLRHKSHVKTEGVKFRDKIEKDDEVLLESHAKCESKAKTTTKRSLRLRRRKIQNDSDDKSDQENDKLKDIVNLQKEFSDVTLDVPAPVKEVKDIASPDKPNADENLPPILGIQSCPSKSVTRSRRKLFTPRADPLDESDTQPGDSNERLYVPRPSYHRARARRKL